MTCLAASKARSNFFVSCDKSGKCNAWTVGSPPVTIRPSTGQVTAVALHPTKVEIGAFGYNNGTVVIVNLLSGHVIARMTSATDDIQSMAFSPAQGDRCLLAYASKDKSIGIISITGSDSAELLQTKRSNKNESNGSDFNRYLAAVCWLDFDRLLLTKPSGDVFQLDHSLNMHKWAHIASRTIFQLVLAEDLNAVISVSMDRKISSWDSKKKSRLWELSTLGGYVYQLAESPVDNSMIAMACGDNSVRIWCSEEYFSDSSKSEVRRKSKGGASKKSDTTSLFSTTLLWKGIAAKVTCIRWHMTSVDQLLFGMDDGRLVLHSLEKSRSDTFQRAHKQAVYGVSFIPTHISTDSAASVPPTFLMASVGGDGEVLLHSSPSSSLELSTLILAANPSILETLSSSFGKTLSSLPRRTCFDFSPDASRLLLGNADGSIELYTWPRLELCHSSRPHDRLLNKIKWHPILDPFSSMAFTASEDGSVCIFDFQKPLESALLASLTGHSKSVYDIAVSSTQPTLLASSSADGTVRVWSLETMSEIGLHRPLASNQAVKLFSVLWSSYKSDTLMFGGDDQAVSIRPHASIQSVIPKSAPVFPTTPQGKPIQPQQKKQFENPEARPKPSGAKSRTQVSAVMTGKAWITPDPLESISDWLKDGDNALLPQAVPNAPHDTDLALSDAFMQGGDISETILKVIQSGKLNDAWVAWSAAGGFALWRSTSATYASMMATKGDYYRSVHYYCAIRDFEKAIGTFEKANMFQDAVSLASLRLPPHHPRIQSSYVNWANYLAHRSQHAQAASAFVAAGEFDAAITQLTKAATPESLLMAVRLSHKSSSSTPETVDHAFWDAVSSFSDANSQACFLTPAAMDSLATVLDFISSASRSLFLVYISAWHALRRDFSLPSNLPELRPAEASNLAEMAFLLGTSPSYTKDLEMGINGNFAELEAKQFPESHLPGCLSAVWGLILSIPNGTNKPESALGMPSLPVDELLAANLEVKNRNHSGSIGLLTRVIPVLLAFTLPVGDISPSGFIRSICLIGLAEFTELLGTELSHLCRATFHRLASSNRAISIVGALKPPLLHVYDLLSKFLDSPHMVSAEGPIISIEDELINAMLAHRAPSSSTQRGPSDISLTLLAPTTPNPKKRLSSRFEDASIDASVSKRVTERPIADISEASAPAYLPASHDLDLDLLHQTIQFLGSEVVKKTLNANLTPNAMLLALLKKTAVSLEDERQWSILFASATEPLHQSSKMNEDQ